VKKRIAKINHAVKKYRLFSFLLVLTMCSLSQSIYAHQTPASIVLLDVSPGRVNAELQLPLSELELAFGHEITRDPLTMIERLGPQLKEYLKAHIHPFVTRENPWLVDISDMKMDKGEQPASGPLYWELIIHVIMKPPAGVSTRKFMLDYDVIMHQVINHAAFISIRNDWETGQTGSQPVEAGVIRWDTKDNVIYPLEVNLEKGSWWKGFKSMVNSGMLHIKEGTDHLLFLLVLLLPATLLVNGKRWGRFGGTKYSIIRLLKIVTAFTIGHSITLLAGAVGWVRLPSQPVEVLIATSILISAIHAFRPVFPGKEIYIAGGFGLIHGLAFASVLAGLNLGAGPMALSILGFNMGIELMQLFIIVIIVPWLILLSSTPVYKWIRIFGAIAAGMAAIAWICERISGNANFVTILLQRISLYVPWLILLLAVIALINYMIYRSKKQKVFEVIKGNA